MPPGEPAASSAEPLPLNIAEGNGKATDGDRRGYFEIARGSAPDCAAVQDVLEVCGALSAEENAKAKAALDRTVAMQTRRGGRGYSVREEPSGYRAKRDNPDSDTDPDADANTGQE
jgi:hypothetical protein